MDSVGIIHDKNPDRRGIVNSDKVKKAYKKYKKKQLKKENVWDSNK